MDDGFRRDRRRLWRLVLEFWPRCRTVNCPPPSLPALEVSPRLRLGEAQVRRHLIEHRFVSHFGISNSSPVLKSAGLTLIELLMVVATIAVLASLLLGVVGQAKTHARSSVCKGHLRQIGFAMILYLGDWGEYAIGTGGSDWQRLISVYAGEWDQENLRYNLDPKRYRNPAHRNLFWICPELEPGSVSGKELIYDDILKVNLVARENVISQYSLNTHGTASPSARDGKGLWSRGGGVKENQVLMPAEMIAVGDHAFVGHHLGPTHRVRWPSTRHRGGANVLFCDGHVQFGKQRHWIEPSDVAMRRWNRDHSPSSTVEFLPPSMPGSQSRLE